jgi:multidrug resistance efflux pump
MIRHIKKRTKADVFENDVRASKPKWGRYIYLSCVFLFFAYIANLLVGPVNWLQADGLVTSDRIVIATPYDSQVLQISVQPGQVVRKGQVLAHVHSSQVANVLATLAAQNAATVARQAELAIRVDIANAVMKSADERLIEAENVIRKLSSARSIVTDASYSSAVRERYNATQERAARDAERRSSLVQLEKLQEAQAEAVAAMNDIRSRYSDGSILAPADGVIANSVARQGDVIRLGDALTEMFVGKKFVLAYLETGTLYNVDIGDRVTVAGGFSSSRGTIVDVLPITVQLPAEFQKTFRPTARGQVARVALDDASVFPLSAKIRVTGDKLLPEFDIMTASGVASASSRIATAVRWLFGEAPSASQAAKVSDAAVHR